MVDMRIIWKAQLELCKSVAEDIVKHNASPEVIEHAKGYTHIENEYGEFWRINYGEAYAYVDIDEDGKPTGDIWWNNDEMGVEHDGNYEGTLTDLDNMTIDEAYCKCSCIDCYEVEDGMETNDYGYTPYVA